jgi:hypothetical protein
MDFAGIEMTAFIVIPLVMLKVMTIVIQFSVKPGKILPSDGKI